MAKKKRVQPNVIRMFVLFVIPLISFFIILTTYFYNKSTTSIESHAQYLPSEFISAEGKLLKYKGSTIQLRGTNAENLTALCARWGLPDKTFGDCDITKITTGPVDYQKLSILGANHVRFGMSHQWWRKNPTQFFQVLDQHIAWARANRLWLVLNLFTLPHGSDSTGPIDCYEGWGQTCPFWESQYFPTRKEEFKNFWAAVAARYKDEPVIAGYNLLNEPRPYVNYEQWYTLAEETIQRIRTAEVGGTNHLVFIQTGANQQFSRPINATNVVYEVHDYIPGDINVSTNSITYPGYVRDWQGVSRYYDKQAFLTGIAANGQVNESANLPRSLSITWANSNNVPLYIGEWGTTHAYTGYLQFLKDKRDIYNQYGLSWAHYHWKRDNSMMALYKATLVNGQLVPHFQEKVDVIASGWTGAARPLFPGAGVSPTLTPRPATPILTPTSTPRPATPMPTPIIGGAGFPRTLQKIAGSDSRITLTEVRTPSNGKAYIKAEVTGVTSQRVAWYVNGAWKAEDTTTPFYFGGDSAGNPNGFTLTSTARNRIRAVVYTSASNFIEASTDYLSCLSTGIGDLQNQEIKVGDCNQDLSGLTCSSLQRPRIFCDNGMIVKGCRDQNSTPPVPTCNQQQFTGSCTSPIGTLARGAIQEAAQCNAFGCGTKQRLRAFCDATGKLFLACRDHLSVPTAAQQCP